jgi:hypothetical protein
MYGLWNMSIPKYISLLPPKKSPHGFFQETLKFDTGVGDQKV